MAGLAAFGRRANVARRLAFASLTWSMWRSLCPTYLTKQTEGDPKAALRLFGMKCCRRGWNALAIRSIRLRIPNPVRPVIGSRSRIRTARRWCGPAKGDGRRLTPVRFLGRHRRTIGRILRLSRSVQSREAMNSVTIRETVRPNLMTAPAVYVSCELGAPPPPLTTGPHPKPWSRTGAFFRSRAGMSSWPPAATPTIRAALIAGTPGEASLGPRRA